MQPRKPATVGKTSSVRSSPVTRIASRGRGSGATTRNTLPASTAAVDTGLHISRTRQKEGGWGGRPAAPGTMPTGARHDGLVRPGWLA